MILQCQHCGKVAPYSVQDAVESIIANLRTSGIEILITKYNCQPCKAGVERIKAQLG